MDTPFLEEYKNRSSPEYKKLEKQFEEDLFNKLEDDLGDELQAVRVLNVSRGSVIVDYVTVFNKTSNITASQLNNAVVAAATGGVFGNVSVQSAVKGGKFIDQNDRKSLQGVSKNVDTWKIVSTFKPLSPSSF